MLCRKLGFCDVLHSEVNFVMARSRQGNLKQIMDFIDVQVVDLDNTPGIEGMGYARICVPSYQELDELGKRLCKSGTAQ